LSLRRGCIRFRLALPETRKMRSYRHAIVFLDWDTARRVTPEPRVPINDVRRASHQIDRIFAALQNIIAGKLRSIDSKSIFRVRWRLYHGWYEGKTKTTDFAAIEKYLLDAKTHVIGNISFGNEIVVACALLAQGKRAQLYDSKRRIEKNGQIVVRQKMVDTGLVCDLLHSVRISKDDIHLIYGSDDDLLPGLFTAEAWGGHVHMFRPDAGSKHLPTANIVTVLERY